MLTAVCASVITIVAVAVVVFVRNATRAMQAGEV